MQEDILILTNNCKVWEKYREFFEVELFDTDYAGVLLLARDRIHRGCRLLTHPLAGSMKPNQIPYKSIMLEKRKEAVDWESLSLIEKGMESVNKILQGLPLPDWNERALVDFRTVDLSLMETVVDGHPELFKRRNVA